MTKRERKYIGAKQSRKGFTVVTRKFKAFETDMFSASPSPNFAMLIPKHASYIDKRRVKWNKYGGKHYKNRRVPLMSHKVKRINRVPLKLNIPKITWIKGE